MSSVAARLSGDQVTSTWEWLEDKLDKKHWGCWNSPTGLAGSRLNNSSSGYPQVSVKESVDASDMLTTRGVRKRQFKDSKPGVRVLCHHLALVASNRPLPTRGEDVSHLCHNRLCCNPDHLIVELHGLNMKRQNCLCTVLYQCPHPSACDEGEIHEILICTSKPPCIFPDNELNPNR